MSELYTVIYKGTNVYSYKMTSQERRIVEHFRQELIDICNILEVPRGKCFDGSPYMGRLQDDDEFKIKYKEDIGFFVLCGERGMFNIIEGYPTKNIEEAKFILLQSEFTTGGYTYELNQRDMLKKVWTEKYNIEYDPRKAVFEYVISMLNTVFKRVPDNVIAIYEKYMRHWYFNRNTMTFEEILD